MKREEELARRYLYSLGFSDSDVVYEPDGRSKTPDFLVHGRIAVEVRRLNQHEITTQGKPVGIESLQFALNRSVREVLRSIGPQKNGKSWFLYYKFRRPLRDFQQLKSMLKHALALFEDDQPETGLLINDHFTAHLALSSTPLPHRFSLGGYQDRNAGGWTAHELQKNIEICIKEKTAKIAKVRTRYPEWWLTLIDQIGYGERESVNIRHNWDKVIVIDPLNPKNGYEL